MSFSKNQNQISLKAGSSRLLITQKRGLLGCQAGRGASLLREDHRYDLRPV